MLRGLVVSKMYIKDSEITFGKLGPQRTSVKAPARPTISGTVHMGTGAPARQALGGRSTSTRRWSWGLRLTGYGRNRLEPVAAARMTASGSRVEYRRGSVVEWYRNTSGGLEQGFTLLRPPTTGDHAGGSTLRLELRLRGDLKPRLERQGRDVDLFERGGRLWTVDSDGQGETQVGSAATPGVAAWAPSGRTSVYSTYVPSQIVVQDLGSRPRVFADVGQMASEQTLESKNQTKLINPADTAKNGIFTMTQALIDANIATLKFAGYVVKAADLFDRSISDEVYKENPSLI